MRVEGRARLRTPREMSETLTLSLRNLGRAVREALAHPPGDGAPPASLDLSGLVMDPPRMGECTLVEGATLAAIPVGDEPVVAFEAFLDGTQRSHVVDYAGTVPIVAGRTAAVIRRRADRRMTTWDNGHLAEARLYAPLRLLGPSMRRDIEAAGLELHDTLVRGKETSGHPIELLRFVLTFVIATPAEATSWVPSSTLATEPPMRALISLAAVADR